MDGMSAKYNLETAKKIGLKWPCNFRKDYS